MLVCLFIYFSFNPFPHLCFVYSGLVLCVPFNTAYYLRKVSLDWLFHLAVVSGSVRQRQKMQKQTQPMCVISQSFPEALENHRNAFQQSAIATMRRGLQREVHCRFWGTPRSISCSWLARKPLLSVFMESSVLASLINATDNSCSTTPPVLTYNTNHASGRYQNKLGERRADSN